jgi:hypothetical protein
MELNAKCAAVSHEHAPSRLQGALCILAPQTISLALSIRELIRQGYLFGAKVLVRPLTERAVTIFYLFNNPGALDIWGDGWDYKKRPNLKGMLEHLNQQVLHGKYSNLKGLTHSLNSATHGDPLSAQWNVVLRDDGVPVFLPSKNLSSPGLADEVCADVIPWVVTTMGVMCAAFGLDESAPNVSTSSPSSAVLN